MSFNKNHVYTRFFLSYLVMTSFIYDDTNCALDAKRMTHCFIKGFLSLYFYSSRVYVSHDDSFCYVNVSQVRRAIKFLLRHHHYDAPFALLQNNFLPFLMLQILIFKLHTVQFITTFTVIYCLLFCFWSDLQYISRIVALLHDVLTAPTKDLRALQLRAQPIFSFAHHHPSL